MLAWNFASLGLLASSKKGKGKDLVTKQKTTTLAIGLTFGIALKDLQNAAATRFSRQLDGCASTVIRLVRISAKLQQSNDTLLMALLGRDAQGGGSLFAGMIRQCTVVKQYIHDIVISLPGAGV